MREVVQTMWVVCDQAVVSLASFLTTVIVGRICGREELGIYVLGTTTFWLLAGIPNALAWTPYTSRAARMSPRRRARYNGSVTIHMAILTVAIVGVFLARRPAAAVVVRPRPLVRRDVPRARSVHRR